MATVKNWFNEFQRGRTSVFDEPRPSALKTTTEDNVIKIHDLVLADRRWKIREIAETVGMSKDCVGHMLHEMLGMRKLSARWVPRWLTPANKRNRETTSEQCLTLFKRNPKEFLRRFVTIDETWIHWYTPENKEQSKQWTSPGEPAPKKAKTVPLARKVKVTFFLGFTRCDLHRLPEEGQNGHRAVLCRIIGPLRRRIAENTVPFGGLKKLECQVYRAKKRLC